MPRLHRPNRIGALELQNLSVTDNRNLLVHHLASLARLGTASDVLPELLGAPGGEKADE
jgi:hypothetical protein